MIKSYIIIIELVNQLQNRIISSRHLYYVSSIHQRSYGLPIPTPFPRLFNGVDKSGFISYSPSDSLSNVSSVLFPSRNDKIESFTITENKKETITRSYCDSIVGMTGKIYLFILFLFYFVIIFIYLFILQQLGMGFDSNIIAPHLDSVLSVWRERGNVNSSILTRSGLSVDECQEIDENLATLATNYSTNH